MEIKEANKDDRYWNSLLRKRQREKRDILKEKEELEKRPKNFALQMIPRLERDD